MFPDVDRKAWRALFAAQLGWMLDAMDFLLFTFALVPIQKEFALTKAQIGIPLAAGLFASAFGGMFFGHLADRIGRVRAMTMSIICYSVATAARAATPKRERVRHQPGPFAAARGPYGIGPPATKYGLGVSISVVALLFALGAIL